MTLALAQAQEKKGEEILETLTKRVAAAKTIQVAVKLELKTTAGERTRTSRVTGTLIMGEGNKAFVDLWPDNHSGAGERQTVVSGWAQSGSIPWTGQIGLPHAEEAE